MQTFFEEIKTMIFETLDLADVDPEEVTPETPFFDGGLDMDSIDVLELAVAVEQAYGVRIDNRELGQKVFTTLGSLADYIEANRGKTAE